MPAAGVAGRLYFLTDGILQWFDDGSAWHSYYGSIPCVQPPDISTFTQILAGGRTLAQAADQKGGLVIQMTNGTTADDYRLLVQSTPATPYTITAFILPTLQANNYSCMGLCWRQSSTGNMQVFGIVDDNGPTFYWRNESANNSGSSPTYTTGTDIITVTSQSAYFTQAGNGIWLRISDDGTNRSVSYSVDGLNFIQLGSQARTTTITPDQWGVFVGNATSAGTATQAMAYFASLG